MGRPEICDEEHCCCKCQHLAEDLYHCCTEPKPPKELVPEGSRCVCSVHKGWVCLAPEFPGVYSGWTPHGLCEMFDRFESPKVDAAGGPAEPVETA